MTEHIAERKARGAFFTPRQITEYIAGWAVRSAADRVLEPSCGEAEFLVAVGERQRALGAGLLAGEGLRAIELHGATAELAERRMREAGYLAEFIVSDFFDIEASPEFDAVVGNPPFIRYQDFTGGARRKALAAALSHGVRLSGLASSWAAFVVHAAEFLHRDGRLGLVLPAELLTVKYAAPVRRYLLEKFAHVRLVMFEELVFPGVLEEIVLLLAEGKGPSPYFEVYQARDLTGLERIDSSVWVPYEPNSVDKWLSALVPSDTLATYRESMSPDGFVTLRNWGESYLGIVTGGNRYFTLAGAEVKNLKLPQRELLRISPPGSRHLRGFSFTENAWRKLLDAGRACYLFAPDPKKPSPAALGYVEAGEIARVHEAYKCRSRTPWWRVPLVPVADLLLTYMDSERPRLVTNRAGVYHLNSLYGVTLQEGLRRLGRDLLPIASLNSLTLLGAELVGRAYGGGILKLEPREADRLPMPSKVLLMNAAADLRTLRSQVGAALRRRGLEEAMELVDRVLLFKRLGLSSAQVGALREARALLFRRRHARATGSNSQDR